ncbi:hypothetical protein AAVH_10537 [Aphelenchoides avenae]|nr:hypothetical protein AAVH_10537 [Aphelenchus avenae]
MVHVALLDEGDSQLAGTRWTHRTAAITHRSPQPPMTFFPELYPSMPSMPMPPGLTSGEHGPNLPACTVPSAAPYNGMESVARLQGVVDPHTDADMASAQNLWVNDFKM